MSSKDYSAQVMNHIDETRDEVIGFLQKIVSIPSVTGEEAEIQKYIAGFWREKGLAVESWEPDVEVLKQHPDACWPNGPPGPDYYKNRPNVVVTTKGKGGGRSLLFNGHVDVIPAGPKEAWTHPPWGAEISDGKLYGRGASDMKSGVATMTMAVKTIMDLRIPIKGDITIEYVIDEELGSNGTLACVLKGIKADAGICCETSNLNVQPGAIGRCWFEIKIQGKPTGVQRAWEGINAIDKGYTITTSLAELEGVRRETVKHPLYPSSKEALQMAVGAFNAGSFYSAFPDNALLKGSFSTLPGEKIRDIQKVFGEHIATVSKADTWLQKHPPEVSYPMVMEAYAIPTDHPVVKVLSKNFEKTVGLAPQLTGRMGASGDSRYLSDSGTPTVIFGPGNTAQMHANNEWTGIEDLITATKTVALSIIDWCVTE